MFISNQENANKSINYMNLFVSSWLHSYIEYKTKSINKQIKHTKKQKKQAYKCRQQNGGSQRRSGWSENGKQVCKMSSLWETG